MPAQWTKRCGSVDVLTMHLESVLLGGGTRLFADLGGAQIRLVRTRPFESPTSTRVRYRVVR